MSGRDGPLARIHETVARYLELGSSVEDLGAFRAVRNPENPQIWDANFASGVRAQSEAEIDEVLAAAERAFDHVQHRHYLIDPETPSAFEAHLALLGYRENATLELLLEGELRAKPRSFEIRQAESESDWVALAHLQRLDHLDAAERRKREPYSEEVSLQLATVRRAKAPYLRVWIARVDGVDCACFSSWPGTNGIGKVEDLFTLPEFRRHGIATALIARAVDDARARGAGPVLIGAEPDDTPKAMYAAMGFEPVCIARSRVRAGDDG